MITVNELIAQLQKYVLQHPLNARRMIYLDVDDNKCVAFGSAKQFDGLVAGEDYLVFTPDPNGHRFRPREMKIITN